MSGRRFTAALVVLSGVWLAGVYSTARSLAFQTPNTGISSPQAAVPSPDTGVINKYCVSCHNDRLRTGGLVLQGLDAANPSANPDVWERVIARLRAGSMPPSGLT